MTESRDESAPVCQTCGQTQVSRSETAASQISLNATSLKSAPSGDEIESRVEAAWEAVEALVAREKRGAKLGDTWVEDSEWDAARTEVERAVSEKARREEREAQARLVESLRDELQSARFRQRHFTLRHTGQFRTCAVYDCEEAREIETARSRRAAPTEEANRG